MQFVRFLGSQGLYIQLEWRDKNFVLNGRDFFAWVRETALKFSANKKIFAEVPLRGFHLFYADFQRWLKNFFENKIFWFL